MSMIDPYRGLEYLSEEDLKQLGFDSYEEWLEVESAYEDWVGPEAARWEQ